MKARKMFLAFVLSIACALTSVPAMPASVSYAAELAEDVVEIAEVVGDEEVTSEKPEGFLGDEDAINTTAKEPESWGATPDANQYKYHKDELAMFVHFGPNTFNEIEWGEHYGDRHPSDIFRLNEEFDAKTLVEAAWGAGFKKIIITAKHHDGFCIWPSKWTTYDAEEAGYTGDILAEISEWCTEYNIDMGLYLSPWDIYDASYGYYDADRNPISNARPDEHGTVEGDALDYNDYYNNQLEEILGNDKYGNNGHFVEVWMDGAKGSGANSQEYDFQRWFTTIQQNEGKAAGYEADCMLFGAGAYTTVHWIGNESGLADSNTWSKIKTDKVAGTVDTNLPGHYALGYEDGNTWSVPEADARITSGWFWGENKKTPKSVEELANMYFNSVGHNAPLLLNVPPNNQGTTDQAILDRLTEFGRNIQQTFDENMAKEEGVVAYASSISGNDVKFKPGNVLDSSDDTYWAPEADQTEGQLIIDLGRDRTFDVISIEESIKLGQRINSYTVDVEKDGEWVQVNSGTTIGAKRLVRMPAVTTSRIRITVGTTSTQPFISSVGVFKATRDFEISSPIPEGFVNVDNTDKDTSDGYGFSYNGWVDEEGIQYVNGTNMYKNGGSLTLKFTGTKVYLIGTVDPNHGKANVSIDGGAAVEIDTNKSPRQVGAIIFESATLSQGEHTLVLEGTQSNKAIGIEAAAVLNNGGIGAIELEQATYYVPEETQNEIKIIRKGGSAGEVSVRVAANPGTAIQGDFDADFNQEVVFANGETEKTVVVATKRNTNETGDRYFTVELSDVKGGAYLAYNDVARVTIQDTESIPEEPSDIYSAENPFVFPATVNETVSLEAERSILTNSGDGEAWPLERTEATWASGGKFVNSLNANDKMEIPYSAQVAGVYKVVATYRSGSGNNKLVWTDSANKIVAGEQSAGNDNAEVTKTVEFNITIAEAGTGVWTFTGPANGSPQLDKLEITFVSRAGEYSADDPFVFPATVNETVTLEAERSILHNLGNSGQQENGEEKWKLCISDGDWASGGQFVNCLNENDKMEIPYSVQNAGTYKVVATYRSGSGSNKLVWTDSAENIVAGEQSAGNGNASVTKTVEFTITVAQAGSGVWTFTGPSGNSPQLDKFEITLIKEKQEFGELVGDEAAVNNTAGEPEAWGATPDANQYKYHKDELAMFVHFSINTFTGVEWGDVIGKNDEDRVHFTLQTFDADTLVKTAQEAGFKKVVVTAKHHDGFCIWKSQYTEHDVESTVYEGDVLEEISKACTKYGLDMGLYLSPWDANNKSYGYYDANGNALCGSNGQPLNGKTWDEVEEADVLDYNEYYNNQLVEILGNDKKYGRNGEFVEVWMDGAKGSGATTQNYDFKRWFATIQQYEGIAAGREAECMLIGAEAYSTIFWIGNENGIAHSNTWAKIRTDKTANESAGFMDRNQIGHYSQGFEDGNTWAIPEADARITSGWFWGENKKTPKSLTELATMYFESVGHNATLLLNVPPNNQGTTDQAILDRLAEFGRNIQQTFDDNMVQAKDGEGNLIATAYASSISGNDVKFKPGNVLDSSDDTYWAPEADQTEGQLMVDLGRDRTFDVISIEESIKLGQRINSYKVEVFKDGAWEQVDSGTTIGSKRLVRIPAVTARQIRITVGTTSTQPFISSVGVYKASKGFELGTGIPTGMITIDNTDKDVSDGYGFSYDGWTQETGMQYLNGTNMWANGGSLTLKFTGTQVFLIGTYAFNHGKAEVSIDGGTPVVIDTKRAERAVGSIIYESGVLSPGEHTLTLTGIEPDLALGVEGAAVLNNGGAGMIELEQADYTVAENAQNVFKVLRKGGSTGSVTVRVAANPGTAIQGDFNADFNQEITFEDGETEKTVVIATKRNTNKTGDRYFTVELSDTTGGAILGFKDVAQVKIKDTEEKAPGEREGLWIAGVAEEYVYTGSAIKPVIQVYDNGVLLQEKTDYTVSYKNNTVAYTYNQEDTANFNAKKAPQVVVKLKGNYSGMETIYFKIMPASLEDAEKAGAVIVEADKLSVAYKNNKQQMPVPNVILNGKKLKANKDFEIPEYKEAKASKTGFVEIGEHSITIKGIGNYTGDLSANVVISNPAEVMSMSKVTVKGVTAKDWTPEGAVQSGVSVLYQKKPLVGEGDSTEETTVAEYTVRYENNKAVGTAYMILTGTGEDGNGDNIVFKGTKTVAFKVNGKAMKTAEVAGLLKEYSYAEGAPITPTELINEEGNKVVSVSHGGIALTEGDDYTVSYQKNVTKGTASIIFTGKETAGYTGTKKVTFKIVPKQLSDVSIDVEGAVTNAEGALEVSYTKGTTQPKVTVTTENETELVWGTDYTVTYKNNKKVGDNALITVKGKGNYAGSKEVNFKVVKTELSREGITLVAKDKIAGKAGVWKQSFKVYDVNGKALAANKDYKNVTYMVVKQRNAEGSWVEVPVEERKPLEKTDVVPANSVIEITVTGAGDYEAINGEANISGRYRILAKGYDIGKATIQLKTQEYTGEEILITDQSQFVDGKVYLKISKGVTEVLDLGTDIEVVPGSYVKNVNKGTAKVTFRGKEGTVFGGTKTVSFKIASLDTNGRWGIVGEWLSALFQ